MAHSHTFDTIILQSHDIGDADRFLILFTRERGRIAARAKGVRKLTSRFGGHLLVPNRIRITLHEGSSGYLVTGAQKDDETERLSIDQFYRIQRGFDLLLALLHDEEPMEDIFDALCTFLHYCQTTERNPVLPFTLQLLASLGVLPDASDLSFFGSLTDDERYFIEQCTCSKWEKAPIISDTTKELLLKKCLKLAENQSDRALRAIGC